MGHIGSLSDPVFIALPGLLEKNTCAMAKGQNAIVKTDSPARFCCDGVLAHDNPRVVSWHATRH